jgi:NAD(P)-dependent dehydrogenase (short-subunit alcohol dehydrogenase family)
MPGLDKFSLSGRNVLLTGASGYLGAAMAWSLAECGATVFINSRSKASSEKLVHDLRNSGLLAETAVFDLTNQSEIDQFFITREAGPLHCLINNAYGGSGGTVQSSSSDAYTKSFDVGLTGAHRIFTASLPGLRRSVQEVGDASVINIASMYGMVSPDLGIYGTAEGSNPPFYGATKAALIQWTRYAACEFGSEGIRVNSISPGAFPSKPVQENHPDFIERLERKIPMGRIGKAEEVCGPVIFLASLASSYVNGANLTIDGGWTAW